METFSNLSLSDVTDTSEDVGIDSSLLNLSLNGGSQANDAMEMQLKQRFMPFVPVSPSPLRHSVNGARYNDGDALIDLDEDLMEVDEVDEVETVSDAEQPPITPLAPLQEMRESIYAADFKADTREQLSSDDEDEKHAKHVPDSTQSATTPTSTSIVRKLFSPTQLGAETAGVLNADCNHTPHKAKHDAVEGHMNAASRTVRHEWLKDKQVNFHINNNYYYGPARASGYTEHGDEFNRLGGNPKCHDEEEEETLPAPWSPESEPHSKLFYDSLTYFQWTFNTLTVSAGIVYILRLVRKDMHALWATHKRALQEEIALCQLQYDTNQCATNGALPAMAAKCREWGVCSQNDVDKFFHMRLALSLRLLGTLINELIQPLGWKPILVIALGILLWVFSSNFLFGFARAKYYYGTPERTEHHDDGPPGDPSGSILTRQHRQ
ncbi:Brl1p KNAG_0B04770 [Huiozyma naganishii CBS 8797]|uniref:Brl1/Brr6 domain-containing protein n=1 Tax=Huiozyma naganishii (strain ATCC MYA-139 / BCRC 22969 / CBS 8797 / KCTC 17520 / NBRC 10181 / NCYC 3082 / Yp74L-3) TaxID=1071383 RepID=J7RVG1_HUIN7|nr:hypothetical protein KNAG_0B04770 [Kazachstania naganishii CBS 8797]CCK68912.1 hypothetical protein KNAG_0B04770 [Kazachstania naganishii CBS 8797]